MNTVSIWALYWDTNRNLWVGTNDGVWKLNIDSGFCIKIPIEILFKDPTPICIRAIAGTKDGTI